MNENIKTKAAAAVADIKALDVAIAELQEARAARVADLLEMADNKTGKVVVDGGSFTVSESNRYDQNIMRANLLPGQVKRCSVSKLDSGAVKRLYPEVYAMARVGGGYKVSIG